MAFGLGLIVIVAAVAVIAWLSNGDDQPDVGTSPEAVVQEFLDRRAGGDLEAALELMTPEVAERERTFFEGLELWNSRGEQQEPCLVLANDELACVLLEVNDFHAAAGLTPYATTFRLTVDRDGLVSRSAIGVSDWGVTLQPFNHRFMAWLLETHPEAYAGMTGVPMGGEFNAEDARIALEHVDEFVAQSDQYPVTEN